MDCVLVSPKLSYKIPTPKRTGFKDGALERSLGLDRVMRTSGQDSDSKKRHRVLSVSDPTTVEHSAEQSARQEGSSLEAYSLTTDFSTTQLQEMVPDV